MSRILMRDAFFDRLYDIARNDRNVIVMSADFGAISLDRFRTDLSAQFFNVGVAEQGMVDVAAGLALSGKKVYTYTLIPFATLRCYEQIKIDLALMKLPITVVGVGAGYSYDDSGPTHHGTEDIAVLRTLPNMTILNASDGVMAARFAEISYQLEGPSYVRLDREYLPSVYPQKEEFREGIASLRQGSDLVIVATGNMIHTGLEVCQRLSEEGFEASLLDLYRIKPISGLLLDFLAGADLVVTLEEHLLAGGMGSAVAEILADHGETRRILRFGIRDIYPYAYGGRKNIQKLVGLDQETIMTSILSELKKHSDHAPGKRQAIGVACSAADGKR